MDRNILEILRCPMSGGGLRSIGDNLLVSENGQFRYRAVDGIFDLLTPVSAEDGETSSIVEEKTSTQRYYDNFGWQPEQGSYGEMRRFVDTRPASWSYTSRCITRIQKFLPPRGRYLLDVASGPITHPEYMDFHAHYDRRICIDFSIVALREARRKLGERGIYILGDLARLPIRDNSIDAAVSLHTIYHMPAEEQDKAFTELHRVLKPGGRAAIVYTWSYSPITTRLSRLLDRIGAPPPESTASGLYYHPHSKEWFLEKKWPFHYQLRCWRTIGSSHLQRLGTGFLYYLGFYILFLMESAFPGFFGRYGQYPLIIIDK